jgi:translation elongation factor EF-Ts
MLNNNRASDIKKLRGETGIGLGLCSEAYDYANCDHDVAIAYLKAKTLAVATPGMSFDERVQWFLGKKKEG